jgi:hypothetical protein
MGCGGWIWCCSRGLAEAVFNLCKVPRLSQEVVSEEKRASHGGHGGLGGSRIQSLSCVGNALRHARNRGQEGRESGHVPRAT